MFDFDKAALEDIVNGFYFDANNDAYSCLFCDAQFERGMIYPINGSFADAEKAARLHIADAHGSVFDMLLCADKRASGLTDTQKSLLRSFYDGKSDKDIASESATAQSTVRYQRFAFREKARQAKIILALSTLLEERQVPKQMNIHKGAKMVDERYMTTDEEAEKILGNFFESRDPLRLKVFSAKEKNKLVTLREIARQFEAGRRYSEPELNEILKAIYHDFATIRRYLIEYGFMDRARDCSEYWLR